MNTLSLRGLTCVALAALLAPAASLAPFHAHAQAPRAASATYVVNTTADPGDGTCDAVECTLREAIAAANGTAARDAIHFNIPGAGVHSIIPATALPALTTPVVIDGYTQPGARANTLGTGNDAVLLVELNGNGAVFAGLTLTGDSAIVRGLVINRFDGNGPAYGLVLRGGRGHVIAGNWIGTDAGGTVDLSNSRGGIYLVNSTGHTIGGTTPADRNVILGSSNPALFDEGTGGGHTIQGNYIGTNAAGTAPLNRAGITLVTPDNLIGGTSPGARNVLSTAGRPGIRFSEDGARGNIVQGNYIGVTADGTAALAEEGGSTGIEVMRAGGTRIGGTSPDARNVIATRGDAIHLFGNATSGSGTLIQGNYIGTNAAGTAVLPRRGSAGAGVRITGVGNATVGGTAPGAGNVIGGASAGIMFYSALPGNVVQGNLIGTNAAGTAALPNHEGILFAGTAPDDGNLIGGTTAAARNVISGNLGAGIRLARGSDNTIQGNYIGVAADGTTPLGNGAYGIELSAGDRNTIGGTATGAGNVIAHNGGRSGLRFFGGTGNALLGNAVYANLGFGFDLGSDGPTPNDPGDADEGPNRLQNTPVLSAVGLTNMGALSVTYRVDSAPEHATYPLRIEFFRARTGEAPTFLGADPYAAADYAACTPAPCAKSATFAASAPFTATDSVFATATDAVGNTSEFTARPFVSVGSETLPDVPTEIALRAPWPNPAAGRTVLDYDLAAPGPARLAVYDVLGREVAVLVNAEAAAGRHTAALDVRRLAAGVYVARLTAGGQSHTRLLMVLH